VHHHILTGTDKFASSDTYGLYPSQGHLNHLSMSVVVVENWVYVGLLLVEPVSCRFRIQPD
jgi:hypothetical protein